MHLVSSSTPAVPCLPRRSVRRVKPVMSATITAPCIWAMLGACGATRGFSSWSAVLPLGHAGCGEGTELWVEGRAAGALAAAQRSGHSSRRRQHGLDQHSTWQQSRQTPECCRSGGCHAMPSQAVHRRTIRTSAQLHKQQGRTRPLRAPASLRFASALKAADTQGSCGSSRQRSCNRCSSGSSPGQHAQGSRHWSLRASALSQALDKARASSTTQPWFCQLPCSLFRTHGWRTGDRQLRPARRSCPCAAQAARAACRGGGSDLHQQAGHEGRQLVQRAQRVEGAPGRHGGSFRQAQAGCGGVWGGPRRQGGEDVRVGHSHVCSRSHSLVSGARQQAPMWLPLDSLASRRTPCVSEANSTCGCNSLCCTGRAAPCRCRHGVICCAPSRQSAPCQGCAGYPHAAHGTHTGRQSRAAGMLSPCPALQEPGGASQQPMGCSVRGILRQARGGT